MPPCLHTCNTLNYLPPAKSRVNILFKLGANAPHVSRYLHAAFLQQCSFPLAALQLDCCSKFDHLKTAFSVCSHLPLHGKSVNLLFYLPDHEILYPHTLCLLLLHNTQAYKGRGNLFLGLKHKVITLSESPHLEFTSLIPGA